MTQEEFETFLEDISVCFIDKNFEQWERHILLPMSLVTRQGPVTLYDRDELRENFEHYLTACKAMKLDRILRFPLSLEDCQDGTFIGTYLTELLSNGTRQAPPYIASALIEKHDGEWRMRSILNARGHHEWTKENPKKPQNR